MSVLTSIRSPLSPARIAAALLVAVTVFCGFGTAAYARPADTGPSATSTAPAAQTVQGDDHVAPDPRQVDRVLNELRAERRGDDAVFAGDVNTSAALALAGAAMLLCGGAVAMTLRRGRAQRA